MIWLHFVHQFKTFGQATEISAHNCNQRRLIFTIIQRNDIKLVNWAPFSGIEFQPYSIFHRSGIFFAVIVVLFMALRVFLIFVALAFSIPPDLEPSRFVSVDSTASSPPKHPYRITDSRISRDSPFNCSPEDWNFSQIFASLMNKYPNFKWFKKNSTKISRQI